jgi:geranylgeranyl diphosphate synthase type II
MNSCDTSTNTLETLLKPYLLQIEKAIQENIETLGAEHHLKKACLYSLLNGGKRYRPALVLMIGDAIGTGADISLAALAIEYFHTASLVVDDLPCMDDDDERRNRPSTHKIYGETMALLVSYALIAEGYRCLAQNAKQLEKGPWTHSKNSDKICTLALECAGYNTGLLGATGGQYLDIFPPRPLIQHRQRSHP